MNIYLSRYQMKKKKTVNSTDYSDFEYGTLVKVMDDQNNWGVADLKPWPLLGDLTLQEELETEGPLFRRSLELAKEDLVARKNKVQLLLNKPIENNWLVTDFESHKRKKSISGTMKIKCNNQIDRLLLFLVEVVTFNVRLRLDFNGSLREDEFESFIYSLPKEIAQKIEYIEDPIAEINSRWLSWNHKIPLAVDFAKGNAFDNEKLWSYIIVKPSRQDAGLIISKCHKLHKKFTLTSSMDHPVGLAHGLRYAQKMAQNPSGFLTLEIYEPLGFTDYFELNENYINFSAMALQDFGIGMTQTLEKLMWVRL